VVKSSGSWLAPPCWRCGFGGLVQASGSSWLKASSDKRKKRLLASVPGEGFFVRGSKVTGERLNR
jgi:hypothetical protein